jgi:hypothetical protein
MINTKGLFALEYSFQLRAWYIDDLELALNYNIGVVAKGQPVNDFRILAISASREELSEFQKSLEKQKRKKAVMETGQ